MTDIPRLFHVIYRMCVNTHLMPRLFKLVQYVEVVNDRHF